MVMPQPTFPRVYKADTLDAFHRLEDALASVSEIHLDLHHLPGRLPTLTIEAPRPRDRRLLLQHRDLFERLLDTGVKLDVVQELRYQLNF